MIAPEIKNELKPMLIGMIILNTAVSVLLFILGLGYAVVIGLFVGTAYMCGNMIYLGLSVSRAVKKTVSSSKKYMVMNYFLRYFILGAIVYFSYQVEFISPLGVIISLFYVKPVYAFNKFILRKEE